MASVWSMANTRIVILGGFLLIVCLVLFSWKNGPFFRSDVLWKFTASTVEVDKCFVPTLVDNTTVALPEGLHCVLKRAATEDSTVIVTILNKAWAVRGSLLDLFLESFRKGERTSHLLKHLILVSVDKKAYELCKEVHPHCHLWKIEGRDFSREKIFMTPDYLDLMWDRLQFLRTILELGYNFVSTDADVMWLRNPFPVFHNITGTAGADITIACDRYRNPEECRVNGGFYHAKSNNKTTMFLRYWHGSRDRSSKVNEQAAFDNIKHSNFVKELGLKIYYLDTKAFSGFCEYGKDLGQVYTMHATCLKGLKAKLCLLRSVMEDWGNYTSKKAAGSTKASHITWRMPKHCRSNL